MALIIKADDLKGLISLQEAISAVEEGFISLGKMPSFSLPRLRMLHEDRRLTIHPGGCVNLNVAGTFIHYERFHYTKEAQHYGYAGKRVYVAYDSESAELFAIIIGSLPFFPFDRDEEMFATETALTSAVGTKYLARPDSRRLGLYGTGRQAKRHLMAMCVILPIEHVKVYSRSPENRRSFCEVMKRHVSIDIEPVEHPEAAARDVDVIVCATGSNVPVLFGEWLSEGVHVTSIVGSNKELLAEGLVSRPRRELDDTVLRRADVVVATLVQQAKQDEQGDLLEPIEREILKWEDITELGALVSAKSKGRTSPKQIALFKQNSDQGVGFMALARLAYDKACSAGIGIKM